MIQPVPTMTMSPAFEPNELETPAEPLAGTVEASLYCHSYPLSRCRMRIVDEASVALCCDVRRIPRHAYLELAFELPLDGGIKRFREAVHLLDRRDDTLVVGFSFGVGPALEAAMRQWLNRGHDALTA